MSSGFEIEQRIELRHAPWAVLQAVPGRLFPDAQAGEGKSTPIPVLPIPCTSANTMAGDNPGEGLTEDARAEQSALAVGIGPGSVSVAGSF